EVRATILATVGGKLEQKQSGAAANLQNALRFVCKNTLYSLSHPLAHLRRRYWFVGITAPPAAEVKRRVVRGFVCAIGRVPDGLPLLDLLVLPGWLSCRLLMLNLRHDISDQTFAITFTDSIFPRNDHAFAHGGMLL